MLKLFKPKYNYDKILRDLDALQRRMKVDEPSNLVPLYDDNTEVKYCIPHRPEEDCSETDVKYSISLPFEEEKYIKWEIKNSSKTFRELLFQYMDEKRINNVKFYKAARLDRKLFSSIKANEQYSPSKDTAIACCFGLKLDIEETLNLLGAAGYGLSMGIARDRVVFFCISNRIYDLDVVYEIMKMHSHSFYNIF